MVLKIDYDKCCWKDGKCVQCSCSGKCTGCVEVCFSGALERKDVLVFHADKCNECGACVMACKHKALILE
jgi:Fe-S-cluster-containing hydrogenase component 2